MFTRKKCHRRLDDKRNVVYKCLFGIAVWWEIKENNMALCPETRSSKWNIKMERFGMLPLQSGQNLLLYKVLEKSKCLFLFFQTQKEAVRKGWQSLNLIEYRYFLLHTLYLVILWKKNKALYYRKLFSRESNSINNYLPKTSCNSMKNVLCPQYSESTCIKKRNKFQAT